MVIFQILFATELGETWSNGNIPVRPRKKGNEHLGNANGAKVKSQENKNTSDVFQIQKAWAEMQTLMYIYIYTYAIHVSAMYVHI